MPTSAAPRPARCRRSPTHRGEGVLIDNVKAGRWRPAARRPRSAAPAAGPARPGTQPEQNLADLRAQIAANERACRNCARWSAQFGLATVAGLHGHVQDNAEAGAPRDHRAEGRRQLHAAAGQRRGDRVAVDVDAATRAAPIDFTGTSAQQQSQQLQRPGGDAWPRCCTCSARWSTTTSRSTPAASSRSTSSSPKARCSTRAAGRVVAGNVETSTCITNALFGALGVMAPASAR